VSKALHIRSDRARIRLARIAQGRSEGKVCGAVPGWDELSPISSGCSQAFANNAEAVNEALRLVIQLTKLPLGKKQELAKP
jgi:hypothetical protein